MFNDILTTLAEHSSEMNDKLSEIYNNINKPNDYLETKIKASVPLLNLLGLNIECSFDIKEWSKNMYQQYELKLFKLFGYI